MSNFKSEFFKSAEDLSQAKDDAVQGMSTKKERLDIIRKFSNGLATLTPEEAKKLGRKEITNHLTTYSNLLQQASMFESMATGTNALLDIIVSTGDLEADTVIGQRMAKILNEGAIHHQNRFQGFWKTVSGEIVVTGGPPVVWPAKYGYLPEVSVDMIFPKGTGLRAGDVTYAFEPKEFTMSELKKLLKSVSGKKGHSHDAECIRALMKALKKQIADRTSVGEGFSENEKTESTRTTEGSKHDTIPAWAYYEVKFRDDGTSFVSKTIFTDAAQTSSLDDSDVGVSGSVDYDKDDDENQDGSSRIISYFEEAYSDAAAWIYLVCIDSEIGGVKNVDTCRGLAELMYPSGTEMETLLNLLLEGDKERAKPKYQAGSSAKVDDILGWDIQNTNMVPDGVTAFEMPTNAQQLQTPFAMLDRNAARLTGSPVSNSAQGGELRVQQQERMQSNSSVQANRISEATNHLDVILEIITWRILAGEVKAGTDGYQETMWCRAKLEEAGIDFKKLAEREHGRFKWIRVRAKRVIGNGDRQQQGETADWIMSNLQFVEPASRPILLRQAFMLKTGDPDLAEAAIRVPSVIMNQQRLIAENETDTIFRLAASGTSVSPQPDDIHQNHLNTHLLAAQGKLAQNDVRPWDMLDTLEFAALMTHISEHIQILISNPVSNYEGTRFLQPYEQLLQQSKPIFAEIAQREQEQQGQLTPKEQADLEIKMAELELKAQDLGIKWADMADLQRIRASRAALSNRNQYVKEIDSAKRFQLEKQKLDSAPKETKAS